MNLENVTAELRPRSEWEAADFGVRMVRRDAPAIYRVWFCITLPLLAVAVLMILYSPYPALAAIVYWWLEPVADGPILRIISRRLFGEDADVRAALRTVHHLAWRNRIFLLTPYRFHIARSVAMPLTQLEGLKGAARRARAKVLNPRILNHGAGVTIVYQHLALALYLGVILIGFVLVPTAYQDSLGLEWMSFFWQEGGRSASVLSLLVVYLAQTALQPWFVGAGFGLYINCRTRLEAWDIEVAFRRMVQRRGQAVAASLVLLLLVLPTVPAAPTAFAEEQPASDTGETPAGDPGIQGYWEDEELRGALESVMASDALRTTREVEEWRPIDPEPRDESVIGNWLVGLIAGFGRFVAAVVEFGFWIALAILAGLMLVTRERWLRYVGYRSAARPAARRVVLAREELSADELPDDVPAKVIRLWTAGRKREALSLLYRASVLAAVIHYGVRLPASATEGDCLLAVRKQTDEGHAAYFRRVVSLWIRCAYGFEEPDADSVLPLCREWPRHYGRAT